MTESNHVTHVSELQSNSVLETLGRHVSIRAYQDRDISEETLQQLWAAAQRAPTSSNMQAYSLVIVRDKARKARLAFLAGGQRHVAECPVFLAICADIRRLRRACEQHGERLAQNTENTLVATIDAALLGMALYLAAESIGLGGVMIGGMRNQPTEVAQELGLPSGVYVTFGMCLGWPAEAPLQKPRLPLPLIVHREQYDEAALDATLEEYDEALAAHYRDEGRRSPDAAWTGVVARGFGKPRRADLRERLEGLGFSFE